MKTQKQRRAALLRERRKLVESIKAEGFVACAMCGRAADDLHEPGKRSQGADPSDPAQVIPVCRRCHDEIHRSPLQSARDGWLESRKA